MTATFDSVHLLEQTRARFPRLRQSEIEISPIEKGGSDRQFYRLRTTEEPSLILVKYNSERAENRHYVQIARFLCEQAIHAPTIYFHDAAAGLIWLEDLGERDLWSYRAEEWPVRRPLYQSALAEAAKLHGLPAATIDQVRPDLQPDFDAALYQWEQDYFFAHCHGRYFGMQEKLRAELQTLPVSREAAERLAGLPRGLVHRDFNSQNLIIRGGQAYLIDFQGMRLGLPEYDLASLLYDPYVQLTDGERDELFIYYRDIRARLGRPLHSDGEELVRCCAMQRLMQALGAYGYLGLVRGNKSFLAHIPSALASLRSILPTIPGAAKLQEALADLSWPVRNPE